MSMWKKVILHVEAGSPVLISRVKSLDAHQLGWGTASSSHECILDWMDTLKTFDGQAMLEAISEVLGEDGRAWLIVDSYEDIPDCTTFYYLGDGVKSIHFTYEEENSRKISASTTKILKQNDFLIPVMDMPDEVLLTVYCYRYGIDLDMDKKTVIQTMTRYYADLLGDCDYRLKHFLEEAILPIESIFISPIITKKLGKANYNEKDFIPNIDWEQMETVHFTPIEKKRLEIDYTGRVNSKQNKQSSTHSDNKYTVQKMIETLGNNVDITFDNKHIVIENFSDSDKDRELIVRIENAGGIVHQTFGKKTDYLIFHTNGKRRTLSAPKLYKALIAHVDGRSVSIITADQANNALSQE